MAKRVIRIKEFPNDDRVWRLDWLGAVDRNDNVQTENCIEVYLRPVSDTNKEDFGSSIQERVCCQIGVGQLPLLSIGSLWKKQCLLQEKAIDNITQLTNLTINTDTTKVIMASHKDDENYLIDREVFDIGGTKNGLHARCLAIKYQGDPYGIIIPIAEIIRFYYASSSDLSIAAFSGLYESDLDSMIGEFHHLNPEGNGFILQLRQWLEDSDGWTIARILQNACAEKGVKNVHGSLVKSRINFPRVGYKHYPESILPFEGTTDWRARSILFEDEGITRKFILELLSCSAPFPFDSLTVIRDNDGGKADPKTDLPDEEKKEINRAKKLRAKEDEDLPLQSEVEPNKGLESQVITLSTNRFGFLADKKILKVRKDQCKYKAADLIPCRNSTSIAGLGTGLGTTGQSDIVPVKITINEVDNAISNTRRKREKALPSSFDVMIEAVHLLNTYPSVRVRCNPDTKHYIPLLKPPRYTQWSYLDSKKKIKRLVMIVFIYIENRCYWLVEFEQRQNEKYTSALVKVFPFHGKDTFNTLLTLLARKKGCWKNIKQDLGLKICSMKHSWSTTQEYAKTIYTKSMDL